QCPGEGRVPARDRRPAPASSPALRGAGLGAVRHRVPATVARSPPRRGPGGQHRRGRRPHDRARRARGHRGGRRRLPARLLGWPNDGDRRRDHQPHLATRTGRPTTLALIRRGTTTQHIAAKHVVQTYVLPKTEGHEQRPHIGGIMKFSYLTLGENRWPGFERDDPQYYGDYLRLARELDKLDYMTLWTGEHHFAHVAAVSSPT